MKQVVLLTTVISLIVLTQCERYEQDQFREHYVVESYLIANQNLSRIWVTTTVPANENFYWDSVGIRNASVEVRLLNSDSTIAERYTFRHASYGHYRPVDSTIVKDERLYQLHVTLPSGDVIEAKTFVPGDFETVNQLQSSYLYQNEQVEIISTPSSYPGRPTYYMITTDAADTSKSNLTPFYKDLIEEKGGNIKTYYTNSSSIINAENYKTDGKRNIILKVPWATVAFFGQNKIVVNAIDDNIYDFWRSYKVQTGGSVLAPGEIQNIRYNVNGGIGIFGSMACDTNQVKIVKPE